ncbi:saccharopine dehydrogenase-like NADP-dependent oxidoreductase [Ancylomarina subtilis]|uniref:Saccharopine dehydrogenase-like NADP-dependent oxidoreductase n=1 Tax=Ancylomarina subtilis TaxID=1639035 RepID=A0A4Q7V6R1_9BACT|nr:saccharopine dehydrogenase C-terminal domain-containing protein [Ancylomarina subtilis]RZT91110.1 saccharopine dehydrogenase-like NADP-dependent oxidoreductase [Ancylomarina subtilis]
METILIVGAGLSSTSLIDYLLEHASENQWQVRLADMSLELAQSKIKQNANGFAFNFDVSDKEERAREVDKADLVISMLPPPMHPMLARECVKQSKPFLSPSYVSPEMQVLDKKAKERGVLLLNELGVDPGIDHMSAMKIIDEIKAKGGELLSFRSYCGGILAPSCSTNIWQYKFTWNPRNVVTAGQGVATYKEKGQYKYLPYQQVFAHPLKTIMPGYGDFEVYPNRDSLSYRSLYHIEEIPSILRGTMRRPGFCQAWNAFVSLGCTDESYVMRDSENLTYKEYIESFLPYDERSVEVRFADCIAVSPDDPIMEKFRWLDLFSDKKVGVKEGTPALILQKILEEKWTLDPDDKDLLVMQHQFVYQLNGQQKKITSSMSYEGKDQNHTAMAYTVGLPLAIAAKLILQSKISLAGVQIPVSSQIYEPVLKELKELGVYFTETVEDCR